MKEKARPPSPIPLSVVPLELTAWIENRLLLFLRHDFLLACCSLAAGMGEHASSCLSSSAVSPAAATAPPLAGLELAGLELTWLVLAWLVLAWLVLALAFEEAMVSPLALAFALELALLVLAAEL